MNKQRRIDSGEKTPVKKVEVQKFAAGGVGKIRHEQSNKSGKPKK